MDNKERFDQIEALLAELLRRADRQDEFNQQVMRRFDRMDERFARVDERFDRVDERFDRVEEQLGHVSGQIDGILGILKISAEAHRQSEERQEQLLREIREQGRRTDITQGETLRLLQALETQQAGLADLNRRVALTEGQEPRIQRLEDEVFRK